MVRSPAAKCSILTPGRDEIPDDQGILEAPHVLPASVQLQAKIVYRRWQTDPFHPSLDFKRISRQLPVYSVRIGRSWRALGKREDDTVTWFWIGSHEAYNTLLNEI